MIRKFIPIFALLIVAAGVTGSARAATDRAATANECAPGYHIYSDGSCQSDNLIVDSRCPPSFTAQSFPNGNGYRCIPETWPGGGEYRD
jgi:hypothetical protein